MLRTSWRSFGCIQPRFSPRPLLSTVTRRINRGFRKVSLTPQLGAYISTVGGHETQPKSVRLNFCSWTGWLLHSRLFKMMNLNFQELLAAGLYLSAVTVLESALRIGSCSLKLRGSVFSALSSAHWALNQLDKAIG